MSGAQMSEMATGGATGTLRRFELEGIRDTGRKVGHGSYAVVKEFEYHHLKCVGKKIHGILFESATPHERAAMLERFAEECELLAGLHHPCIVQFLGVWFQQGSQLPVLVMEYLHTTLSACLETYSVLPEDIGYGILRDVALGLCFLHKRSPPIIHRDLSANNVLLTSNMNAKLSDLGVAKILNLTPARMTQMTQTKAPGTPCYMPPEALIAKPKYTLKIDVYSYGVLIIHTLCGRWPFPEDAFCLDPQNPDAIIPVPEVERRAEYLQEIGNDHPLMAVIRQCLSNVPARRPEAPALLDRVNTVLSELSQPFMFTNRVEMLQQFEARIQTLIAANQSKQSNIDTNKYEIDSKQSEIESLKAKIRKLSAAQQQSYSQSGHTKEPDKRNQPHFLHPQARLQWKIQRCADMPVDMCRPQVVVMGEKVYMGGGYTKHAEDKNWVFQYEALKDEWSCLPPHHVTSFAMAQFAESLITVGGEIPHGGGLTGKVYCFNKDSQKWEEFLKPMTTARCHLSVVTTQSAIVASGGNFGTGFRDGKPLTCATVEVYSSETAQWHSAADPLPVPYGAMTSVTIADTWYLLGGGGGDKAIPTVLYAPLSTLIQKATSAFHTSTSHISVWKTLLDTPLMESAAASLSGSLLAVGGWDDETIASQAVHIFHPLTNSWIRATTWDLPEPCCACTTVQLAPSQLLVVGGCNNQRKYSRAVFLGSITMHVEQ